MNNFQYFLGNDTMKYDETFTDWFLSIKFMIQCKLTLNSQIREIFFYKNETGLDLQERENGRGHIS